VIYSDVKFNAASITTQPELRVGIVLSGTSAPFAVQVHAINARPQQTVFFQSQGCYKSVECDAGKTGSVARISHKSKGLKNDSLTSEVSTSEAKDGSSDCCILRHNPSDKGCRVERVHTLQNFPSLEPTRLFRPLLALMPLEFLRFVGVPRR
jgi:hypothetical protein